MAYVENNHVRNYSENFFTPAPIVFPLTILMRKSKNLEADMKLLKEKFGEIRSKKVGIFMKLFPADLGEYRDLISFMSANNFRYLTPKWIKTYIKGLPCDLKAQKIKKALIDKGLYVEEVVQMVGSETERPLPLFQVKLVNSDRNKNIFYMTDLLNFKISVGRIERAVCPDPPFYTALNKHEKNETFKTKADVFNRLSSGESSQVASSHDVHLNDVSGNISIKQEVKDVNMDLTKPPPNQTNLQDLPRKISEVGRNIIISKQIADVNNDQAKIPSNQTKCQELPRRISEVGRNIVISKQIADVNNAQAKTLRNQTNCQELPLKISEVGKYKAIRKQITDVNKTQVQASRNQTSCQELPRKISEVGKHNVIRKQITDAKKAPLQVPPESKTPVQSPHNQTKPQELSRTNNSHESKICTDVLDINHIMQEFRELLEKIKDLKAYAIQIRRPTD